jgi:hypothetical protein
MGSGGLGVGGGAIGISWSFDRQHFLYFLPLPQGQGSLRPAFIVLSFPHLARAGNRILDPITCLTGPGHLYLNAVGGVGIPKDSAAGRRVFEGRLERRRGEELRGEFKRVERGWCVGGEEFRP